MEKIEVTLSFDSAKMEALVIYLKKENSSVQSKMDEALRQLYEQMVPEPVREYLDAKSSAARPKRPPRPSQPKPVAPKPAPDPVKSEKEDTV